MCIGMEDISIYTVEPPNEGHICMGQPLSLCAWWGCSLLLRLKCIHMHWTSQGSFIGGFIITFWSMDLTSGQSTFVDSRNIAKDFFSRTSHSIPLRYISTSNPYSNKHAQWLNYHHEMVVLGYTVNVSSGHIDIKSALCSLDGLTENWLFSFPDTIFRNFSCYNYYFQHWWVWNKGIATSFDFNVLLTKSLGKMLWWYIYTKI